MTELSGSMSDINMFVPCTGLIKSARTEQPTYHKIEAHTIMMDENPSPADPVHKNTTQGCRQTNPTYLRFDILLTRLTTEVREENNKHKF